MLYDTCLFQKGNHFQLKIKIRKTRYNGRRKKEWQSDGETEERLKGERRKPGKEKVWHILCTYFVV